MQGAVLHGGSLEHRNAIIPASYSPAHPLLFGGQGEGPPHPPFEDCFEPIVNNQ